MSESDCNSYACSTVTSPDKNRVSTYSFNSMLFDFGMPYAVGLYAQMHEFAPALPLEDVEKEGEILLRAEQNPIGIIITQDYLVDFHTSDSCKVKSYSEYYELPIFLLCDDKLLKIT